MATAGLSPTLAAKPATTLKDAGRIVIVVPASMFGDDRAPVTADGKTRRRNFGKRTLEVAAAAGSYDVYSLASAKPLVSLSIKRGDVVYLVKRVDADSKRVLREITSAKPGREQLPFSRTGNAVSPDATITLVRPPALLGAGKQPVTTDGKEKARRIALQSLSAGIVAGAYDCIVGKSGSAVASVSVKPGEALYIVNSVDARSQRQLGDVYYDQKKRSGAFALYRRALALDATQTDLYVRYADLAVIGGGKKEAIDALKRVVSVGLGDGRTYQTLGDLLLAGNQAAEAQAMYDKALATDGNNGSTLAKLGDAKRKSGDLVGAAHVYEQAILLEPDSADRYLALGAVRIALKDSSRAMETYRALLEKNASYSGLALAVGAYEFGHRRFKDAAEYLAMVKGKQAGQATCQRMLGESYYSLADYKKALPLLRDAAMRDPKSPEWPATTEALIKTYLALDDHVRAGLWVDKYVASVKQQSNDIAYYRAFLKERSAPAAAQPLYEKNTQLFPNDYRNYLRLGALLSKSNASPDVALKMLKKAVALADTVSEAWLELARLCKRMDRPDEELGALQVIVASDPKNPEANTRIGVLMMQKGETDEAMRRLEAVRASGPDDPQVLKALAQGYARSGNLAGAIEALQKAKKAAPDDLRTRELLIDLDQKAGNAAAARAEMKELLNIRRDNPTLLVYARLSYQAGDFAEATDAIENIRATEPENLDALMLLGSVLRAQKKYPEAFQVYQEAMGIDDAYYPALYERAEAHLENSQPMWAEAFYNRALRLNPKYARAELGLAKVAKQRHDAAGYARHVNAAYKMAPADSLVKQEYEVSRQAGAGQ
jgi:tetratricopeptide (TPR) repeat protein